MRAVIQEVFGGPDVLRLAEVPEPTMGEHQVLVDVFATALNRADLLQRRGLYPPPPGVTDILGLEFAGVVSSVGSQVAGVSVGDRVMGLASGGTYAERVVTWPRLLMRLPDSWSFEEGASVPEAFLTASEALFSLGQLSAGEQVLIHAAAGGVGSAAVLLARARGARVVAVVGTTQKKQWVEALGADLVLLRGEEAYRQRLRESGGIDVVLDFVGKGLSELHLDVLSAHGRWIVIGLLGGKTVELDLSKVLTKRIQLKGLVMRTQPLHEKVALTERFIRETLPHFSTYKLRPLIDSVFPIEAVSEAHLRMEENQNLGKVVLKLR